VLDGAAARGDAFVGGPRGVSRDHFDAAEVDVQLVSGDLGQRGHDALADLYLAGERGYRAVRVDAKPTVEHAVLLQASRQRRGRLGESAGERRERESHRESSGLLQEPAPG